MQVANGSDTFRFEVAFSFAGTHRDKVRAIAELVSAALDPGIQKRGQGRVFYDDWFEHRLNGDNADVTLQRIYHEQSRMVVMDVSNDYAGRPWCQAEASAIRSLRMSIDTAGDEAGRLRLAYIRFDAGDVPGLLRNVIHWDGEKKTAEQLADLILKRLAEIPQPPSAVGNATTPPGTTAPAPPNPFQTAGQLRHDHSTYLPRRSDAEFKSLLYGSDRFIAITGVPGIGKSSLMQQTRRLLPKHDFFGGGLAGLRPDDPRSFMKNFFEFFEARFGVVDSCEHLAQLTRHHPSVLFLDDLGEIVGDGIRALVPALVEQLSLPEATLRVIATSPGELKEIFRERRVNPKHCKPWKHVHVLPCQSTAEWRPLLDLLSPRAKAVAGARIPDIETKSWLAPQRLQCLCRRLFDGESDGRSDAELAALIAHDASYDYK